jgi:hypothetical protein
MDPMEHTGFQGEVLKLLERLTSQRQVLEVEIDRIDSEIEAVTTTARLLKAGVTADSAPPIKSLSIASHELSGLTTREALKRIASTSGGKVRVSDVKDILIDAGILKRSKNTWNIIYTILKRSPEFVRCEGEPGTYELLAADGRQPRLTEAS